MFPINSKDNRHIKAAVRIRNGKEKGLIFVEGRRLAHEAVRSRIRISEAFFSADFLAAPENTGLAGAIADRAKEAFELPAKLFAHICDTKTPQGIALICERPVSSVEDLTKIMESPDSPAPLVMVLDRISNPGNLGSVFRTAEAAGVKAVVTTIGSVDAFAPAVLRGSMGAAFRIPVVEKAELAGILSFLKEKGFRIFVTRADGATPFYEADWSLPAAIVFGSEAHGIQEEAERIADVSVSIPMEEGVESLNLGVSAGIILFEARRVRRSG